MKPAITKGRCEVCGIPMDAEYFDVSGFVGNLAIVGIDFFSCPDSRNQAETLCLPRCGEQAVLASFQLNPQYCGVLIYFAQYTDLYARDNSQILTPGFEWLILQNGKRVFPYTQLEMIVNPWGNNCLPVTIRLDEHAKVEFVLRNRNVKDNLQYPIHAFAGRLVGRYWYNEIYGGRESSWRE